MYVHIIMCMHARAHTHTHTHTLSPSLLFSLWSLSFALTYFLFLRLSFYPSLSLNLACSPKHHSLSLFPSLSLVLAESISSSHTHSLALTVCYYAGVLKFLSLRSRSQPLSVSDTSNSSPLTHTPSCSKSFYVCYYAGVLKFLSLRSGSLPLSVTHSLALTLCVLLCWCIKVLESEIRVPASVCHTLSCSNSMCVTMLVY